MRITEIVEQIHLAQTFIAVKNILEFPEWENQFELFILSYEFWVAYELFEMLSPFLVECSVLEHVDVFFCHFVFTAQYGTSDQIFESVDVETVFHAVFYTPAVAEIQLAVIEIKDACADQTENLSRARYIVFF